jgi:hypothetical protein
MEREVDLLVGGGRLALVDVEHKKSGTNNDNKNNVGNMVVVLPRDFDKSNNDGRFMV